MSLLTNCLDENCRCNSVGDVADVGVVGAIISDVFLSTSFDRHVSAISFCCILCIIK
jgi:hypothetical protein